MPWSYLALHIHNDSIKHHVVVPLNTIWICCSFFRSNFGCLRFRTSLTIWNKMWPWQSRQLFPKMDGRKHFYARIHHQDHFVHIWWQDLSFIIFGFSLGAVCTCLKFSKCLFIESTIYNLQASKIEILSDACGTVRLVSRFFCPKRAAKSSSYKNLRGVIHSYVNKCWWHGDNDFGVLFL